MRVAVVTFSKDKSKLKELKEFLVEHKVVKRNPELVVVFGGDGTVLKAEEKFPGIPKLFFYKTCRKFKLYERIKEEMKLAVYLNGKKVFTVLNDVNIHYQLPRALRFSVKVNHFDFGKNLIGDGLVVSTPFGANAYFRVITGRGFTKGIGIAYNNVLGKDRNRVDKYKVVDENSKIEVTVNREEGFLGADSFDKVYRITKGDKILIKKSKNKTFVLRRE
jgi:hypothetical protein